MSEITYDRWVPEDMRAAMDRVVAEKRAVEATGKVVYEIHYMGPDPDYDDELEDTEYFSVLAQSLEKAMAIIGAGLPDFARGATWLELATVYKGLSETIEQWDICEDGHLQRRVIA